MNTYLGFDFGTSNITIGALDNETRTYFINFKPEEDPYILHTKIERFLDDSLLYGYNYLNPNCFVFIEGVFKGPNARTYQRMNRIAHSIYILMSEYGGVEVQYITPSEWRKELFGKGNKKKEECQDWAYGKWPFLMDIKKNERGHHADALCIALAGKMLIERREVGKE